MNKKKAYFGMILVPQGVTVKESGAAIVFTDTEGNEHTKQVPLLQIAGTSEQITKQLSSSVEAALGLVDERLNAKPEEKSSIIVPA